MEQTLRLVEGLVPPEQAEKTGIQTDRQMDTHSNSKLHSHPGSGGRLDHGEASWRPLSLRMPSLPEHENPDLKR